MKTYKFISGLVLLLIVLAFTLKMKLFFGWTPDLVLGLLVAYGMVFGFYEVFFFSGFAAWILNWQPWPGPELWILAGIAILAFAGKFFMPWQRWVSTIILAGGGVLALYAAGAPSTLLSNLPFLGLDALTSALFAFIVMRLFRLVFGRV